MAVITQQMTRDALDAFVRKDKALAMDVISRDNEVDSMKHAILEELAIYMVKDPSTIARGMKVSFVAQNLERIADHATNIAEMVIFLVEGRIIRHMDMNEALDI
jgi:phosphate transport system protein